ncbi:hypothetical protein [Prevotella disiens]|uniref:Uncharacterized protein n=1 Tax=Prevotella disiens DNF00882 TaxID=1401075 RepID=A0A096CYN3_9BACT|nr:hypothetical protein [Prevotella disiens]KGF50364.1 hypothetical protein HMPREF0654_01405 [Prevotella disiens DNF00882]
MRQRNKIGTPHVFHTHRYRWACPPIVCGMMTASIISFFIYYKIVIYTAACLAPYGAGYPSTPPYLKL